MFMSKQFSCKVGTIIETKFIQNAIVDLQINFSGSEFDLLLSTTASALLSIKLAVERYFREILRTAHILTIIYIAFKIAQKEGKPY